MLNNSKTTCLNFDSDTYVKIKKFKHLKKWSLSIEEISKNRNSNDFIAGGKNWGEHAQ